ncbi:hypothetical protein B484DRAFT_447011 [Ochromonadaceae sp. CCMP2298]|nr:hypothetical protein B484DRAFT_447011 [Ochromonadaceae sp. CCMP2298]
MAVSMDSRGFARFLYDAMMFSILPFHTPTLLSALCLLSLPLLVPLLGLLYALLLWGALYTMVFWAALQWGVVEYRDRTFMGAFAGLALCLLLSYHLFLAPEVSLLTNLLAFSAAVVCGGAIVRFLRSRPACAKGESKAALARAIVLSAPPEGTDEELALLLEEGFGLDSSASTTASASASTAIVSGKPGTGGVGSPSRPRAQFQKDALTGQLRRVDGNGGVGSDVEGVGVDVGVQGLRARSLGPKLCGCCLTDRRTLVKPYIGSVLLPASPLVDYILPPSKRDAGAGSTGVGAGDIGGGAEGLEGLGLGGKLKADDPIVAGLGVGAGVAGAGLGAACGLSSTAAERVISLATHCDYCEACVLDQDHHCTYLGACVGKGNRRIFWVFLSSASLFCWVFFFCAKWLQQWRVCADVPALFDGWFLWHVLPRELCALQRRPALGLLSWVAGGFAFYFMMLMQVQVTCVARETTFLNVLKKRYELRTPPPRRMLRNLLTFLYWGVYNVTYPKKKEGAKAGGGVASSAAGGPSAGAGGPSAEGGAGTVATDYSRAMQLLQRIDHRMGAGVGAVGAVGAGVLAAGLVGTGVGARDCETGPDAGEGVVARRRTATYSAPEHAPINPPPQEPKRCCDHNHSHGHSHSAQPGPGGALVAGAGSGAQVEVAKGYDSDYDEEFVQSGSNSYLLHYDNDSGEETAGMSRLRKYNRDEANAAQGQDPSHDHSHSHSHGHGHAHEHGGQGQGPQSQYQSEQTKAGRAAVIGAEERV